MSLAVSSLAGSFLAGSSLAGSSLAGSSLGGSSLAVSSLAVSSLAVSSLAGSSLAVSSLAGSSIGGSSLAGSSYNARQQTMNKLLFTTVAALATWQTGLRKCILILVQRFNIVLGCMHAHVDTVVNGTCTCDLNRLTCVGVTQPHCYIYYSKKRLRGYFS